MGRKKIPIQKIENKTNRSVTFRKRSHGLAKKAYELSVLCDIDIAFVTFSPAGNLTYFYNQQRIGTVLQRFIRNIPNMPENERLQVSQDIIDLIDNMAVEDDADDQNQYRKHSCLDEAQKEEVIGDIMCSKAELEKLKNLQHILFNEEASERQKFIEKKLAEIANRKQQLMSQLGSQLPIANNSLSIQKPIQQLQAGNEAGMSSAPPQGVQLQLQLRLQGMGYPALSMQQIKSGQAYWAPGSNPSSSMQSVNWHIQSVLGNPFSSSSSVQTSTPGQIKSEVRRLYGSPSYMSGQLVGRHVCLPLVLTNHLHLQGALLEERSGQLKIQNKLVIRRGIPAFAK